MIAYDRMVISTPFVVLISRYFMGRTVKALLLQKFYTLSMGTQGASTGGPLTWRR